MKKAAFLMILVMVVSSPAFAAKKKAFRFEPVASYLNQAIAAGMEKPGRQMGLVLKDSAQGMFSAMATMNGDTRGTSKGFSLEVYTPFSWVAQQASWKAKKYMEFTAEDVDEEMTEPILRVYANPDTPRYVTSEGMVGTSGVDHVIVRSTEKKKFAVLQPNEIYEDETYLQNAMGGEAIYTTQVAIFNLVDVQQIASLDKKGEFFILVIGSTGEEKKFKVKTKHFERLP